MYLKESHPHLLNNAALQVKLFVHHSLDGIEQSINGWLKQQQVAIYHITQSQSEKQGRFVFVLSVWYVEK
jgi:hypothetical protein